MPKFTIELDPSNDQLHHIEAHSARLLEIHNTLSEQCDKNGKVDFRAMLYSINQMRYRNRALYEISAKSIRSIARNLNRYRTEGYGHAYPIEVTTRGFRPYHQSVKLGRYGVIKTKNPMPVINNYIKHAVLRKTSDTQWVLDLDVA